MIPYKEIFDSLPFAFAYCKVTSLTTIETQTIKFEYFNEQFQQLLELPQLRTDVDLYLKDAIFKHEKIEHMVFAIRNALTSQISEEIAFSSSYLKRLCNVHITPLDQHSFYILIHVSYEQASDDTLTKKQLETTSYRFKQMAEIGRMFVWEVDLKGNYSYVGPTVKDILGYEAYEMIGKTFYDLHPKKGYDEFKKSLLELMNTNQKIVNLENPIINRDGEIVWLMTNGFPIFNEKGDFRGYRGFDQDITDRKISQKALADSEEKYRLLTENISDILWIYNYDKRRFTYFSPSVFNLTGYRVDEVINKPVSEIMTQESFLNLASVVESSIKAFVDNDAIKHRPFIEVESITKDNSTVWVELSFSFRYSENHEVEVIGAGRNIHDRKLVQQQLQYISFHDPLTGLYNRAFYEEELKRLHVKRNLPLSLILADINDLKLTNDAFGHIEGDKLIQEYARILQENCRGDDIVARIGGDEFVLLLPQTDEIETKIIMDRIQDAIAQSTGSKLLLSVAMGSMTTYSESDDFDRLFNAAEDAMYKHKLRNKDDQTQEVIHIIQESFKAKHPKCYQHSMNAAKYAVELAKSLELSKQEIEDIYNGSLFSLIGLLKEPNICIKEQPGRVAENGYHLLKQVPNFRDVADIVLSIFEQEDGQGVPKGLTSQDIPLASKIIRLALDFSITKQETSFPDEDVMELLRYKVRTAYNEAIFNQLKQCVITKT